MRRLIIALLFIYVFTVSTVCPQVKIGGTANVGGTTKVGVAAGAGGGGRSAVFNGTSAKAEGAPADPSDVPSASTGWRFMLKARDVVSNNAATSYFLTSGAGNVLFLFLAVNDPGEFTLNCFAGGDGNSTGSVSWSTTDDFTIQVRVSTAGAGTISLEVWETATGTSLGSNQNTSGGTTTTNFFAVYTFGATGSSSWLNGKIDKALFIAGAGSFGGAMPNVETTTGDIMQWTFDSDTGEDTASTSDLTLTNVTFENTP